MSVKVKNVSKLYGTQKALNDISFELQAGEVLGFLGPNGAGKSTMMKIICGYLPASKGVVEVAGKDIDQNTIACQQKIGYLPEHNPLYLEMYVKEFLHFMASIHQIQNKKERVKAMIELVGLELEQNKKIGELSKGYRQRVGIAQALIHDPEVLILDEPTTGLDPNQIVEIRNLISSIGKNKTVMLSTHLMQEVDAICDRAIILNQGSIVANKSIQEYRALNSKLSLLKVEFEKNIQIEELYSIAGLKDCKMLNDKSYEITADKDIRAALSRWALAKNNVIINMAQKQQSLEDVFQSLTQNVIDA